MKIVSIHNLANILSSINTLRDIIFDNNSHWLHVKEVCHSIDRLIKCYAEEHRDSMNKRTQVLITEFVGDPTPAPPPYLLS